MPGTKPSGGGPATAGVHPGRPSGGHAGPPGHGRHLLSAAAARRRYALISALTWLPPGLMMAPMVLLMTSRGLSLAQVGVVIAVFSTVVVVLELPTGGLADVVGRRAVLAISGLVTVAALGLMAVATSMWPFVVSAVLKGVARALSSGPAQAWYVDTLHAAEGPGADLKPGLSRGEAAGSFSLSAAVLAGGFLPLVAPGGLAAPVVAGAAAGAVLFVVVLVAMPEPPRPRPSAREVLRDVPVTIGTGLRLGLRDAALGRLLLIALPLGAGLSAIEMLTPGRLAALTGEAESGSSAYAVVAAAGFAASALGSWLAPGAARLLRSSTRAAVAGVLVTALAFGALAGSSALTGLAGIAAAAASYTLMFAGLAVTGVLRAEMMHGRVDAARRATLMSVDSLQLQFGAMAAALGLGWLATRAGPAPAWWVVAGVIALSSALFLRLPRRTHPE
ncbi:MFS transporter [Sphaerisporangium sp. TRM90804]|uniref:MFS transporter n=1 Tax=Sphaerisporangium sp. TRM90804 TaxID=3031113 RepID=UPI0024484509|nr:MFS transporter [Sphaerisporangium sp. TRM90804]MDH2427749.1 MFS transporter [Sphaerisporangium sp. TRM90804]